MILMQSNEKSHTYPSCTVIITGYATASKNSDIFLAFTQFGHLRRYHFTGRKQINPT